MNTEQTTVNVPIEWLEKLIRESERFRIQLAMDGKLRPRTVTKDMVRDGEGEREYQNFTKVVETPEKEPKTEENGDKA